MGKNQVAKVVVAILVVCSHTAADAASQAPPSAPVTVVNPASSPVPVSVQGPVQVTISNPVTDPTVTFANPAVRFQGGVSPSANSRAQATIIPVNAVPPGNKLIVAYANLWGSAASSGSRITAGGCVLVLLTSTTTSIFGSMPLQANGMDGGFGVGANQSMFLPLSHGEGLGLDCFTNVTSFIEATFGGYFVPSP